jgi:hypothetical protein
MSLTLANECLAVEYELQQRAYAAYAVFRFARLRTPLPVCTNPAGSDLARPTTTLPRPRASSPRRVRPEGSHLWPTSGLSQSGQKQLLSDLAT